MIATGHKLLPDSGMVNLDNQVTYAVFQALGHLGWLSETLIMAPGGRIPCIVLLEVLRVLSSIQFSGAEGTLLLDIPQLCLEEMGWKADVKLWQL